MRPFRFLAEARAVATGRELADTARRAESIGIDVLVIPDHLIDQLAPIPAMATVAAATERLRMSGFVLNNDLRHPAVLAQDLATLDVLSEGRLEIAIGAGWNKPEYDAIGLGFEPTSVRQSRLAEAVTVLKGCFSDGPSASPAPTTRSPSTTGTRSRRNGPTRRSSSEAAAGGRSHSRAAKRRRWGSHRGCCLGSSATLPA